MVETSVRSTTAGASETTRAESGCYRTIAVLGRGGMAEVLEVEDLRTGSHVAMKRLLPRKNQVDQLSAQRLFEREFKTLWQLAHPRIVAVYDYSVDELGPYYTMELLTGGDLSQLVPMDPGRACRLAKDVCSALSLLHSRSMVHRDLSARNVRCTTDGLAKLIDFGAMAPIGRGQTGIVGTPPYAAPELVNGSVLDPRTDLYALGATLYYALTGRHAYPAKDFQSLQQRWQLACPSPSEYAPDIPAALDELVMALLRLDPLARPASAFEVVERLCAIDGTRPDDQQVVAQAYLCTPTLVGRGVALAAFRRSFERARRGRKSAVVVSGPPGVGRSRFLDGAVLEAKLQGALVVSAGTNDPSDYGAARGLARQLIAKTNRRALDAASDCAADLGPVLPELHGKEEAAQVPRRSVQQALGRWLARVAEQSPLVLVIDDFHAIDEPSAAAFAIVAHELMPRGLIVVASIDTSAVPTAPSAVRLLGDSAAHLRLSPLANAETEELFRSIFGTGPNIGLLAHRVHEIAAGNPRDTMGLAQHLVERGTIRYERGCWSVPQTFDAGLPDTMTQALDARIGALSSDARELARALSLAPGQTMNVEEIELLVPGADSERAVAVVEELLRTQVVRASSGGYALSQSGWARALQTGMSDADRRGQHLRLAEMFRLRGSEEFRRGAHLLRGGDPRALDVLVAHAAASQEETNRSSETFFKYTAALPPDWLETYDEAIRLCAETKRPRKDAYALRSRLCGILALTGRRDATHSPALIRDLAEYTGLAAYGAMDSSRSPEERLQAALREAAARYAASDEHDRVVDPKLALRHLGRAAIQAGAAITTALDAAYLRSLPSLLPLSALSPAFAVVQMLFDGMASRFAGRFEESRARYLALMERLLAPDGGGLDASHNGHTRLGVMNGLGMLEAGIGLDSALQWASKLESVASGRVNALEVRALYHLWQGNVTEVGRLRRQVELLQIQDSPRSLFEGTHLLWQVTAHALSEDLTRIKHALDAIAALAGRYPGWKPVEHYAAGEYHRAGGAYEAAIAEFQAALALVRAGDHQIWPYLAGSHLRALDELGRTTEAVELGERYLSEAEHAGLGYVTCYVLLPLAVAYGALGNRAAAMDTLERAYERFLAVGATGLNMGIAHEARARVALLLGDGGAYAEALEHCREVFAATGNAALVTKYERLRRSEVTRRVRRGPASRMSGQFVSPSPQTTSRLELCTEPGARFGCALAMLVDECRASAAVLYLVGAHGPFEAASYGETGAHLGPLALNYLESETSDAGPTREQRSCAEDDSQPGWAEGSRVQDRPILLSHESADGFVVTGAVVLTVPERVPFSFPARVAQEISMHLFKAGDVTGTVVSD